MSGWKIDSEKYKKTEVLFTNIWTSLVDVADTDHDGKITINEWLAMWESYKKELVEKEKETEDFLAKFYASHDPDFRKLKNMGKHLGDKNSTEDTKKEEDLKQNTILPSWLHNYLRFRFDLLDRVGDGIIDQEEYEYVLSEFGLKEKDARQAFLIFTQHLTINIDFNYFVQLFEEYYLSDDPADLGNFVNGQLEIPIVKAIDVIQEENTNNDEISQINIELYKDDMMKAQKPVQDKEEKVDSLKRFRRMKKRIWNNIKTSCLQVSSD